MTNARSVPRAALITAVGSSIVVAALLGAAALNIGVENMRYHPTPRINTFTVGLGLVPVAALAWAVFLWIRKPLDGFFDIVFRLAITFGLGVGAFYSFMDAFVAAFFVS